MNKIEPVFSHIASMSSHCLKRIQKELQELRDHGSKVWTAKPRNGYDLLNWDATIHSLDDPRHLGKEYRLTIEVPGSYPFSPPKVRFVDRVQCENVFWRNLH